MRDRSIPCRHILAVLVAQQLCFKVGCKVGPQLGNPMHLSEIASRSEAKVGGVRGGQRRGGFVVPHCTCIGCQHPDARIVDPNTWCAGWPTSKQFKKDGTPLAPNLHHERQCFSRCASEPMGILHVVGVCGGTGSVTRCVSKQGRLGDPVARCASQSGGWSVWM